VFSNDPYKRARDANEKKRQKRNPDKNEQIEEWRIEWREKGVIQFAEEVLVCPPDVPEHPSIGAVPEFVILAEDQKQFLSDIARHQDDPERVKRFILAAGRGAGKTFILAVYVAWRMICFDNFTMTVMGGSGEQSEKIKEYIDFWRMRDDRIFFILHRSVQSGNRPARVESRWNSYSRFPACSDSSARGPHVTQLLIDEVGVGEAKGKDGAKAVRSARYQLTSSPQSLMGYTSTAQYILGTFYETWEEADERGFTKYRWSVARHVSEKWYGSDGKPNWIYIDSILVKDKDPNNWVPNVWWCTQEDVIDYRKNSTDDEFLVEVLGGMSRGSGLVFGRDDLNSVFCDGRKYNNNVECMECDPYTDNCPAMKVFNIKLSQISDREMGVDFGEVAPTAITVTGRRSGIVFVLYSDEQTGLSDREKLSWITSTAIKYNLEEILADPEERAMRNMLDEMGYIVPNIWANSAGGGAKRMYVSNVKRYVEKRHMFVPKKFDYLRKSVYGLGYDDRGNIMKRNDHSFDSLLYSMIYYDVVEDGGSFYDSIKGRRTTTIWS
jgi:hypothetical protein